MPVRHVGPWKLIIDDSQWMLSVIILTMVIKQEWQG